MPEPFFSLHIRKDPGNEVARERVMYCTVLLFRSFRFVCFEFWYVPQLFTAEGRISAQFLHNCAFCEESTILTECVDIYTSMNRGAGRSIIGGGGGQHSYICVLHN